jgi:transposase
MIERLDGCRRARQRLEEKAYVAASQEIPPIPEETMRVARAAFPRGNVYMRIRDEFGTIYADHLFAQLFPARGQPAESPWRLA